MSKLNNHKVMLDLATFVSLCGLNFAQFSDAVTKITILRTTQYDADLPAVIADHILTTGKQETIVIHNRYLANLADKSEQPLVFDFTTTPGHVIVTCPDFKQHFELTAGMMMHRAIHAESTLRQRIVYGIGKIQEWYCNKAVNPQISFNWILGYPTKPFESYMLVMSFLDGDERIYDRTLTSDSEGGLLAALLLELNHITQLGDL